MFSAKVEFGQITLETFFLLPSVIVVLTLLKYYCELFFKNSIYTKIFIKMQKSINKIAL